MVNLRPRSRNQRAGPPSFRLYLPVTILLYFVCLLNEDQRLVIGDEEKNPFALRSGRFYLSSKATHKAGRVKLSKSENTGKKNRVAEYRLENAVQLRQAATFSFLLRLLSQLRLLHRLQTLTFPLTHCRSSASSSSHHHLRLLVRSLVRALQTTRAIVSWCAHSLIWTAGKRTCRESGCASLRSRSSWWMLTSVKA